MMDWRNPNITLPEDGDVVFILLQHGKKHGAQSLEIYSGTTCWYDVPCAGRACYVENNDDIGNGWQKWYLKADHDDPLIWDSQEALAWMPASEFDLPDWLEHREGYEP